MKRTIVLLSALFVSALAASAQDAVPVQPSAMAGTQVVRFAFEWRVQNPPHYTIVVDSDGHATYTSEPTAGPNGGSAPDSYVAEWTASDATRTRIFDDVRKLNYLQGHYETNAKVAQTGTKTLSYKDATRNTSTSYNYSEGWAQAGVRRAFQQTRRRLRLEELAGRTAHWKCY
jgi:hypothetical protein